MTALTIMTPEEIKAARAALGLSQRKFADTLGITPQAVENWEYDKSSPPKFLRLALAALLAGLPPYGAE
ncbi:MAG: helix-turn-helix domain-containing protein [Asticcacaulis sp.]